MRVKNNIIRRFRLDEAGFIAPIMGLMAVPLLGITGAAIDFGRAVSQKFELQQELDAATVATCTRGSRDAEEVVRAYMNNSVTRMGKSLFDPTQSTATAGTTPGHLTVHLTDADFDPQTNVISPRVTTQVNTTILKLVGIDRFDVEVSSAVACGAKRLELALMLDTTGSMCWNDPYGYGQSTSCNANRRDNKLTDMKDAVYDVLDMFKSNMEAGATKIGIVPFSESVRPPASVMDQVRNYPSHSKQFRDRRGRWQDYDLTDCVTERNGSHRFSEDAPGPGRWLNPMYSSNGDCRPSKEVQPLSTNEAYLRQFVTGLEGRGGTAGHLGTAWAWYLVSPEWAHLWPASGVEAHNPEELIKAVILMTDGEYNTEYCQGVNDSTINCNSPNGSSKNQAATLCENMKASGVVVYTVGFQVPGHSETNPSSQQRILMDCASDDTKYFFPYDGNQLRTAFQEIGKQLAAGQIGEAVIQD